jgi:filamentous hemagglutinin family protein
MPIRHPDPCRLAPRAPVALRAAALAVMALSCGAATALPVGGQVMQGQASIVQSGATLNVTNGSGAVIHWQGFSIGAGETVRFLQPAATSSVLNRVTGGDPSHLLGSLLSNGRVFLINPAGILVGAGARIDVAGFVASTLNLRTEDFLAGRLTFQAGATAAGVRNDGLITTPQGGQVYLVAPRVENTGTISAPGGSIGLAAGRDVQIGDTALPGVRVALPDDAAANSGRIVADAGRIGMVGALVRNSGAVSASSAVADGGRILLKASGDAIIDGAGSLAATGARGGAIDVAGERVGVLESARIDASGMNSGGAVRIGGGRRGADTDLPNARMTEVAATASVRADAGSRGDGGSIVVWADDTTRAAGSFSARGGALGGDGGFIETSGKRYLDVAGIRVDAGTAAGRPGEWLLDPTDVRIVAAGGDVNVTGGTPFQPVSNNAVSILNVATVNTAINSGTSVTVDTGGAGGTGGTGDIIFDAAGGAINVLKSSNTFSSTLNLNAFRNVIFSGGTTSFQTDAGAGTQSLTVHLNAGLGGGPANVFTGADSTVHLNATATAPVTVQVNNGKTWFGDGTTNLSGHAVVRLYDGANFATFRNNGTFNTNVTGNWWILSNPGSQLGVFNNFGTVNTSGGSVEGIFNNQPGAALNLIGAAGLSLQNAQTMQGSINLPVGSTLAISEFHGTPAAFTGTSISGGGTLASQGAAQMNLNNVAASGVTLSVAGGSTTTVSGDANRFGALSYTGGNLVINNGMLGIDGNFTVPAGVTYQNNVGWRAGGNLTNGQTITTTGRVDLIAGGALMQNGGAINGNGVAFASGGATVIDNAAVHTGTGNFAGAAGGSFFVINGGSIDGQNVNLLAGNNLRVAAGGFISAANALRARVNNDVILDAPGNPHLAAGGEIVLDLLSSGSQILLNGAPGSYSRIEALGAGPIRVNFEGRGFGGLQADGVPGIGPGIHGSGFFANSQPAILGNNLFVRYTAGLPDVCRTLPGLCRAVVEGRVGEGSAGGGRTLDDGSRAAHPADAGVGEFGGGDGSGQRRRPGVCRS